MKLNLPFYVVLFFSLQLFSQDIAYNDNSLYLDYATNFYDKKDSEVTFNSQVLKERLQDLQKKSQLDVQHNRILEQSINSFLKYRKNDIANLIDKSQLYFPIFEKYLKEFDLPFEIKYLAAVESRLEPKARSYMGARGLWQFMPYTGKEYGLKINASIDERLDVIKSTRAACRYLADLHEMFNDWNLALAAYNSGPGNVKKAIRRSGGYKDFWKIRKFLPKETRDYIPSFYTMYYMFEYANKHQVYAKETEISFDEVKIIEVKSELSFKEIQNRFSIDYKLLHQLNPQYKYGRIPYSNLEKNYLILPNSVVRNLVPCRSEIYELAKRNTMNTAFFIGSVSSENQSDCDKNNGFIEYETREGDSLWKISKLFPEITINQLKSWNNLWSTTYIKPGTKLKILTN